jgi:hypothetical protein
LQLVAGGSRDVASHDRLLNPRRGQVAEQCTDTGIGDGLRAKVVKPLGDEAL